MAQNKKSQTSFDFKTFFLFSFFTILGVSAFAIDDNLSDLVNDSISNLSENLSLENLSNLINETFLNSSFNNNSNDINESDSNQNFSIIVEGFLDNSTAFFNMPNNSKNTDDDNTNHNTNSNFNSLSIQETNFNSNNNIVIQGTGPTSVDIEFSSASNYSNESITATITGGSGWDGYIYNWKANNESIAPVNLPFEEDGGDRVTNYATQGFVPTKNGTSMTYTTGYRGGAYNWSTTTDNEHIDTLWLLDQSPGGDYPTICAWYNREDYGTEFTHLWSTRGVAYQWGLYLNPANDKYEFWNDDVTYRPTIHVTYVNNVWEHACVRMDLDDTITFFKDGTSNVYNITTTVRSDGGATIGTLKIGAAAPINQQFTGLIDEFMVFNRPLENAQIEYIYNNNNSINKIFPGTTLADEEFQLCVTPYNSTDTGDEVCSNTITTVSVPVGEINLTGLNSYSATDDTNLDSSISSWDSYWESFSYTWYKNDVAHPGYINTTTTTLPSSQTSLGEIWKVCVVATHDFNGDESEQLCSNEITVQTMSFELITPVDEYRDITGNISFSCNATSYGGVNIKNISLMIDGSINQTVVLAGDSNFTEQSWNLSGLNERYYNWGCSGYDTNDYLSESVEWRVAASFDNPTIDSVILPVNGTFYPSAQFNITASDLSSNISQCLWSVNSGVTNYSMTNQGGYWVDDRVIPDGNYNAMIYCLDAVDNLANTTKSFNVDTVAPVINVTSPQNRAYNGTGADGFGLMSIDIFGDGVFLNSNTIGDFGIQSVDSVTLNTPTNEVEYGFGKNITFGFTPIGTNLSSCSIYGNWNSGWHINESFDAEYALDYTDYYKLDSLSAGLSPNEVSGRPNVSYTGLTSTSGYVGDAAFNDGTNTYGMDAKLNNIRSISL